SAKIGTMRILVLGGRKKSRAAPELGRPAASTLQADGGRSDQRFSISHPSRYLRRTSLLASSELVNFIDSASHSSVLCGKRAEMAPRQSCSISGPATSKLHSVFVRP